MYVSYHKYSELFSWTCNLNRFSLSFVYTSLGQLTLRLTPKLKNVMQGINALNYNCLLRNALVWTIVYAFGML